jgi:hypothetical protein
MTSFRQFEANRRNARKSTGPVTEEGKQRSRCNAVRHGLTAETVIGALEDAKDYKAFEAVIITDYDAQSAVERNWYCDWPASYGGCAARPQWKLDYSRFRLVTRVGSSSGAKFAKVRCSDKPSQAISTWIPHNLATQTNMKTYNPSNLPSIRFLRLANLPNYALDRLSRYEATLWRQAPYSNMWLYFRRAGAGHARRGRRELSKSLEDGGLSHRSRGVH